VEIIGREPIHPALFYSGKISGYVTWILLPLSMLRVIRIGRNPIAGLVHFSYLVSLLGIFLSIISILNLGASTRLGLPTERTVFKTNGLYRFSRNPMYVGFNLITISSMLFHASILVFAMGIFSICVYHLIILAEEKYMEGQFGQEYLKYKSKVRRYF
jgi:protein-S-isoprenylcysteine O-methyltransferase Ste14